jgi:hypothetical protein
MTNKAGHYLTISLSSCVMILQIFWVDQWSNPSSKIYTVTTIVNRYQPRDNSYLKGIQILLSGN